jgi:hypothetical protein
MENNKLSTKGITILCVVIIAALSIYLVKESYSKNKAYVEFDTKQQEDTLKSFNLLIDLARVFNDFNDTASASFMDKKEISVDDFIRKLIHSFTATEVKFQEISKELKSIDCYDQIIRDIAAIASNGSDYSRRYINIIFMIQRNQNSWEIEAVKARITEELRRDWSKLTSLVGQFIDKHKQFLTTKEKNDIINKIINTFKYEYDLLCAIYNAKGPEAAVDLNLPNGGWLPMTMLMHLL